MLDHSRVLHSNGLQFVGSATNNRSLNSLNDPVGVGGGGGFT